jgi:hypothetical protein
MQPLTPPATADTAAGQQAPVFTRLQPRLFLSVTLLELGVATSQAPLSPISAPLGATASRRPAHGRPTGTACAAPCPHMDEGAARFLGHAAPPFDRPPIIVEMYAPPARVPACCLPFGEIPTVSSVRAKRQGHEYVSGRKGRAATDVHAPREPCTLPNLWRTRTPRWQELPGCSQHCAGTLAPLAEAAAPPAPTHCTHWLDRERVDRP